MVNAHRSTVELILGPRRAVVSSLATARRTVEGAKANVIRHEMLGRELSAKLASIDAVLEMITDGGAGIRSTQADQAAAAGGDFGRVARTG